MLFIELNRISTRKRQKRSFSWIVWKRGNSNREPLSKKTLNRNKNVRFVSQENGLKTNVIVVFIGLILNFCRGVTKSSLCGFN